MARAPLCALFLSLALPAQDPKPDPIPELDTAAALPQAVYRTSTGFVLKEGEHDIHDLIDEAARFLGRNILCSPIETAEMVGGPTFFLQKKIEVDVRGCEDLLASLLFTKGLVMVPLDAEKGFWEVLNMNGRRRQEINQRATACSPDEVLRRPQLKIVVLTRVPLQHINATVATNALRPFFAAGGGQQGMILGNVGDPGTILLLGFADQVAAAIRMLRDSDVPLEQRNPPMYLLQGQVKKLSERLAAMAEVEPRVLLKLNSVQAQITELQKALQKKN